MQKNPERLFPGFFIKMIRAIIAHEALLISLSQIGSIHPNHFSLTKDIVTHKCIRSFVTCFSGEIKHVPLQGDDNLWSNQDIGYTTIGHLLTFFD